MSGHLAQIYLHGPLGERFGERHALAVRTPREAVQALDANYPGFLAAFAAHQHYGLFVDGDWRDGDEAASMPFSRELHFCPKIEGHGFAIAPLIAAAFPALGAATIGGVSAAAIIGGVLLAGLMIGISFLLAPKVPKTKDADRDENYAFTGPENVTGQGVAVPLIYGRVYAGSVVVSAGLDLGTDLAQNPAPAVTQPPSSNVPAGVPAPPGGWPPLVTNPKTGRKMPQGWKLIYLGDIALAKTQPAKAFDIYQHPTSPTYYWNNNRGFWRAAQAISPTESDYYYRGGHDG